MHFPRIIRIANLVVFKRKRNLCLVGVNVAKPLKNNPMAARADCRTQLCFFIVSNELVYQYNLNTIFQIVIINTKGL